MSTIIAYLVELVSRAGHWSYVILFLGAMLECAGLLGLFIPGETLIVLGGFLASRHVLDLDMLILTVCIGAIVGDSLGYELGRQLGRDWLVRHGRWAGLNAERLDRVEQFFTRHGGKTVFIGRFIGFLRALTPFVAGASRMRYRRFLLYNALGAILWSAAFALLGYGAGASWRVAERWMGRASAMLGGMLVLVCGLSWLWRWATRHEAVLKRRWYALLVHPRVVACQRRFAPQIQFLQDRLTPGGYLGLHLTVGAAVIILACWWFGGVVEDLLTGDPLVAADQQVALWFHEHATPAVTQVATVLTFFGSVAFLTSTAILCALVLLWRRAWYGLLALTLTMGGGSVLNVALKHLFHRPRPVFEHPLVTLPSASFPSGHVMGATLFYLLVAGLIAVSVHQWRWRVLAFVTAGGIVLLIGLTRLSLGAHYVSDVLGAMAAGVGWLASCLTAVETLRRYHTQTRSGHESG